MGTTAIDYDILLGSRIKLEFVGRDWHSSGPSYSIAISVYVLMTRCQIEHKYNMECHRAQY